MRYSEGYYLKDVLVSGARVRPGYGGGIDNCSVRSSFIHHQTKLKPVDGK